MLKEIPLIPLALVWSLVVYACNSTAPHSSETLPQVAATQPEQNASPQAWQQITGISIWKGRSGGIEIEWTTDDLFAKSVEKVDRIFKSLAKRGHDEFVVDISRDKTKDGPSNCEYRRDFEVLSIVGTLISFADTEYSDCGGTHPSTEVRFTTIDLVRPGDVLYGQGDNAMDVDLRQPGRAVKLTDYFSESDILTRFLQTVLSSGHLAKRVFHRVLRH